MESDSAGAPTTADARRTLRSVSAADRAVDANMSAAQVALPSVAVVVPIYNGARTIAACIESLLAQTYPAALYEIVVVDNNSSDGTPDIVSRYPVTLEREIIQTSYAARNRGIRCTDAEIIAFIDGDCAAEAHWLEALVKPFGAPGVGAVAGPMETELATQGVVDSFLTQVLRRTDAAFRPDEPKGFPTGNVAYRRAALDRVGVFDAAMPGGGDIDLAWRVQALAGYEGVYVPEAVVYHRHPVRIRDLWARYQRYGRSNVVLVTLYRGQTFHRRTPATVLQEMLAQVGSLGICAASFIHRLFRWSRWRCDRLYLAWPLLWIMLQLGYLSGTAQGIVMTRLFRRNPYSTDDRAVRRTHSSLIK